MIVDTLPNGFRIPQVVGAMRALEDRAIIIADQPGAGKTLEALLTLELDQFFTRQTNTLILCNLTGCQLTWGPEINRRVGTQYEVIICDLTDTNGKASLPSLAKRDDILADSMMQSIETGMPLIVIANYDQIRWPYGKTAAVPTMFEITWDAVIVDEAHLVLPTDVDTRAKMTQFWHGLTCLQYDTRCIKLDLTGTPDRGKLQNRYGHYKWLMPHGFQDYWGWLRSNFKITQIDVNKNPKMPPKWVPEVGTLINPMDFNRFQNRHMIRRTKKEMLAGLPEKLWAGDGGIDLKMSPEQSKAYDDYMAYLEAVVDDLRAADTEESLNQMAGIKMQFALRATQMATATWEYREVIGDDGKTHRHGTPIVGGPAKSNKLAWLIDWLESRGYLPDNFDVSGGKVVVVSYYTQILEWLKLELDLLGVEALILDGSTKATDKLAIENRFQNGDLRVVLLSGHLGVSINLDAADDMIFLDTTHDPDQVEQAEDRIHRASRNHQVMYWRLASIGTVDQARLGVIDQRYWKTRESYDGSRGIEFARKMLPKGLAA